LQQAQLQQQQQNSTSSLALKRAKMCAMGFFMGAVVGSTVVGIHAMMNRLPLAVAVKHAASTGGAFGTIFAVGTFIRPVS